MSAPHERRTADPYFSICIPQYNRTSFLLAALRSIECQNFKSFEICVSDDVSNDGRHDEIVNYLDQSGMSYAYVRQTVNQRYDANLRASIALARGRYCFLLGNDDGLAHPDVLGQLARALKSAGAPGVAVTNYRDAHDGNVYRRVNETALIGSGADVAVATFRNFSFVSGVIIRADLAHDYATVKHDGSEMYQVYLVARAIAEGHELLGVADVVIEKDLRITGESVDSYAVRPRIQPCPIQPRTFNLTRFPGVVSDAIAGGVAPLQHEKLNGAILQQLYSYTYPYWLIEFRRVQSWKYALGIALGQRPSVMMKGLALSATDRLAVRARFLLSSMAGLLLPVGFAQRFIAPLWYRLAKRGTRT